MSAQLETFLLKTGLMTPRDLEAAVAASARAGMPLWETVVSGDNTVSEEVLADTFARWFNLPRVRIASLTVEPEAIARIDDRLARKRTCLPVKIEGKSLLVAVANPLDYEAIQDVEFRSGLGVRPLIATRSEILDGIEAHYSTEKRIADFLSNVQDTDELSIVTEQREEVDPEAAASASAAEVPPVVKMCNLVLNDAIKMGASDVHVEPALNDAHVRMRVDGVLRDYTQVPKWLHTPVVSRLKILAHLDISERRLPQDGRINIQYQGKPVDVRVSTLPTHFGEKVVLRVLGTSSIPPLDVMGLTAAQAATVDAALGQPQGMMIVTGPTGSGKSTTLYSMIERRKSPRVNIITVEDPIEYQLAGITQVQVNVKSGLTFASALRSILRQDPDVILVGEVRDAETAEIAFQAAVTGHLVLTTLHTNSSLATIARLLDLGVDPFLLSSSINLIIAQRLARRICPRCKEPYVPEPDVLERLKLDAQSMIFRRGRGCQMCGNTGYAGRTGIYEVLRLTPALKQLIHHRASEGEMRAVALAGGTRFLLDEALRKIVLGHTTPEEVLRVIRLDEEDLQINTCPKCLSPVQPAFSTCPYCLHILKRVCVHCGQELRLDWKACPYCHHKIPRDTKTSSQHEDTKNSQHEDTKITSYERPLHASTSSRGTKEESRHEGDELVSGGNGRGRLAVPPGPVLSGATPRPNGNGNGGQPVGAGALHPKRLRILAVDDDPDMRELVSAALGGLPFEMEIDHASDGEEALRAVEASLPDVVVLDVLMPKMDGFEVCRRLRENVRTAFVPILMLTRSADDNSRTTGYLVGTDDYVTKPFSIPDLHARVMRMVRRTYGM